MKAWTDSENDWNAQACIADFDGRGFVLLDSLEAWGCRLRHAMQEVKRSMLTVAQQSEALRAFAHMARDAATIILKEDTK